MDVLFKRKFLVSFPKTRCWGCPKEKKESKVENVTENRDRTFMPRAASAGGGDITYVEQAVIKDTARENFFEINEDLSLLRMKNTVGFRQNQ